MKKSRTFDPWVGQHYKDGIGGKRVLILGESHYGDKGDETSEFTRLIIENHGIKKGKHRIYARIKVLIAGGGLSDPQRDEFWQKVAFYNYIQTAIARPRIRPTPEQWEAATDPFLDTVSELSPEFVVVLGVELGKHLPPLPGGVVACNLKHPSSWGFSYDCEREKLKAAGLSVQGHQILTDRASRSV